MRVTRRRFHGVALGAAAVAATPLTARAAEPVRIGYLSLTSHAPTFIAAARGYFRELGLDAQLVSFQAAQPMAIGIASGDVDFGITAITGGLISLADKGVIKVIGGALSEAPGVEGEKILASNAAHAAGVTTPAKLAGRIFGITTAGSSFHYMAHKIAQKEGFADSALHLRPLQDIPVIVAALKTGQIDAWSIMPNIADTLVKTSSAVEIGKIVDYIPDYQVTTIFTSTANVNKRADLAKRFLTAFGRGVDDYNAAFVRKTSTPAQIEDMVSVIHRYVYADTPLGKADPLIRAGAMLINPKARLNVASVRDQFDWFKAQNMVPTRVTFDTLVDARFVETYQAR